MQVCDQLHHHKNHQEGRKGTQMHEFHYEELEAATENFSSSRIIGKGSHGCIYKGILKDGKLIAIKKQSLGLQKLQDNSKLDNEIRILLSLPPNPYLITLLGTSHDCTAKNRVIVMEHMPNGTLHDLLHVSPSPPPWPKRLQVAIQVAKAVQFIHEADPSVIHRDIKSANILFDENWNARLADFGLAIMRGQVSQQVDSESLSRPAGTIGYLDPCYTAPCKLSTKNDVFSFGVVLLEIVSATKAIDVCRDPSSIVEWALPLIEEDRVEEICDERVILPAYMESKIRNMLHIAARCVSSHEDHRPSMSEIVHEMENCFVERVRFSLWIDILDTFLRSRRQRTVAKRKGDAVTTGHISEFSKGKMLLKEVLADIAPE